MNITASKLREDVYNLLDRVLETGEPLEIERKGRKLLIVPQQAKLKLAGLPRRRVYSGNPEDFVHMDWSRHWKPYGVD